MAQSTTIANQEQPPTTTQQQLASQQQPLPKIQISQKPPHRSPQKKKTITFLYFPSVSYQPNNEKELKKPKMTYPKEKRIHLVEIMGIHMILGLQSGMRLCLSFQP